MNDNSRTVSELGERHLIEAIAARIPGAPRGETWSGDDTAVFPPPAGALLYTIDALVEGIDFDLAYSTGEDIGHKAMAVNVSDVAAMGGRPYRAIAALSLPATAPVELVEQICDGLSQAGEGWEVGLSGGDLGEAAQISIAVALLGSVDGEPVRRNGARAGDALCVTGSLGGAAGGLRILRSARAPRGEAEKRLVARQLRPQARVEEGVALRAAGASAMIDVSDGLAVDLANLVEASRVGCRVDPASVPADPDLAVLDGLEGVELAVTGGEDFELLFTIERERLARARAALEPHGTAVTQIGTIGDGERTIGDDDLDEWRRRGWEHLRNR